METERECIGKEKKRRVHIGQHGVRCKKEGREKSGGKKKIREKMLKVIRESRELRKWEGGGLKI